MRPVVTKLLEVLGALLRIALLWAVALAIGGCARPAPTPPVAAPVVAPNGDTDDCPGGVVCTGDDCLLPKPKPAPAMR